jgi:hypothetical protein
MGDGTVIAPARQILPVLASFDGTRTKYRNWRAMLFAKIQVDGIRMGGTRGQIASILMALEGQAQYVCSTQLNALLGDATSTVGHVIEYMDRVYDDPQEQQRAADALTRLKQGSDAFETFYAEFERLLALAKGSNWPENIKMQYLRSATHHSIVRTNVANDTSTTLEELATQYCKIAMGLANLHAPPNYYATTTPTPGTTTTPYSTGPVANSDETVPMDIDSNYTQLRGGWRGRGRARGRGLARGRGRGGNSMGRGTRVNPNGSDGPGLPTDARLHGRRAVRVSNEEWQRRREADACLRCGRQGCYVAVCPLAAATPAPAVNAVQVNHAYVEPDLDGVCEVIAAATPTENE